MVRIRAGIPIGAQLATGGGVEVRIRARRSELVEVRPSKRLGHRRIREVIGGRIREVIGGRIREVGGKASCELRV